LLSAGEIPGLYNPEELEPLLAPIREDCLQENFRGTVLQYFAKSKRFSQFCFKSFLNKIY
jgi:dynein heavy chain 2